MVEQQGWVRHRHVCSRQLRARCYRGSDVSPKLQPAKPGTVGPSEQLPLVFALSKISDSFYRHADAKKAAIPRIWQLHISCISLVLLTIHAHGTAAMLAAGGMYWVRFYAH